MDTRTRALMHSGTGDIDNNANWETPPRVWEALNREFRFGVDLTGGPETQHRLPVWIGPGSPLGPVDGATDLARCDPATFPGWVHRAGYSNPPYGPFIKDTAIPFALRALAAGMTTVWLLPLRVTNVFKQEIFPRASEIRLCESRITFYENGEPRWNRRKYNDSLRDRLLERKFNAGLVDLAHKAAAERKELLSLLITREPNRGNFPEFAELHALATKRADPAPFDSVVVVFDPKLRPGLWGATWKLWRWWEDEK